MVNQQGQQCPPRIILVDDHPISRYGIRIAIQTMGVGVVVAEAGSVKELFDVLQEMSCEIVVADYMLPNSQGADGLSMVQRLAECYPDIRVVVGTALRNMGLLREALSQGATGWVDKAEKHSELGLAIREASAGYTYVSKSLAKQSRKKNKYLRRGVTPGLTKTEASVICLTVYESMKLEQIASLLVCSYKAASRHKRDALLKLSLRNDQELYEYCRWVDLRKLKDFEPEDK